MIRQARNEFYRMLRNLDAMLDTLTRWRRAAGGVYDAYPYALYRR